MLRYLLPILLLPCVPAMAAPPLSAAEWLVTLGRDYPLTPQAGVSDTDARMTLLFMQAASRIEPTLAEAWLWQFDMLEALDQAEPARQALGRYVEHQPDDVAARLQWITTSLDAFQTAEDRAEWIRGQLDAPGRLPAAVASDLHRRLASFYYNRGQTADARREADAAVQIYPPNLTARQLLQEIRGEPPTIAEQIALLLAAVENSPGQPHTVTRLADHLLALGYAQEAVRFYRHTAELHTLLPPGEPPPGLQLSLARALAAAGQQGESRELVHQLTTRAASDAQREAIATIVKTWDQPASQPAEGQPGNSRPGAPPRPEVAALLARFPFPLLDYPLHPERYLRLRLRIAPSSPSPVDAWRLTARLENIGPFPITLGEGLMVKPFVALAVKMAGDGVRSVPPGVTLSLQRGLRLLPGESVEVTQPIDVGPIRATMVSTPQVAHDVEISGVVDPLLLRGADGRELWTSDVGGVVSEPLRFRRTAFAVTPDSVGALLVRSREGTADERIQATELLAMLLAEDGHLKAGRLRYAARPIDVAAVRSALLARVSDPDPSVRARLAESMRWFVLDESGLRAAAKLLADPHWLVRGLTLRMLADGQGAKVRPVLTRLAEGDPDPWVRQMGQVLLERLGPATRPAAAPAAAGATTAPGR